MRRTKGAAATVLAVTATLMFGSTVQSGRPPNPADQPAGSAPRHRRRSRRGDDCAGGDRGAGGRRDDRRCRRSGNHRGRGPGDDRGRTGRHRASGDAAGERQRARRRRDVRHQSAAARQPAAGRDDAPAGRSLAENWNPNHPDGNESDFSDVLQPMTYFPWLIDNEGVATLNGDYVARVRRIRRPPHADLHAQPRRGVARRHADHRRRLAGHVERPQRLRTRSSRSFPGRATS